MGQTLLKRLLYVLCAWGCLNARAEEVFVAVAANFTAPMQKIAQSFEQETGHHVHLSFGATGLFYQQIKNAAPFEVLLAADDETPLKLQQEGLAVASTRMTYAQGKLVLWSPRSSAFEDPIAYLRSGQFEHLAIADPKLAPYGRAAVETLTQLGVWSSLQSKLVQGVNITQTYQFVLSESAPVGLVALSQVFAQGKITQGTAWIVPENLHQPIRQDAIVLLKGKDNPAAISLMKYLRSDNAHSIMRSYGYTFLSNN